MNNCEEEEEDEEEKTHCQLSGITGSPLHSTCDN